ncbi:cysteine--tRNA ligase [Candidatus Woesearchaeota archaeon]|nr:cysteine--tRNA ligase [Candidatus Woesearchaeota archaeon]
MTLKLYNTLTRQVEDFKPIDENEVKIYSCGPTVYNFAHIGNLRAYIFVDLLRRVLKHKGYNLNHTMNITDVDDKTIRDSQKENMSLKEFTEKYTEEFVKDLKTLNIEVPENLPRATDHIQEMVDLVKELLDKGFAYKVENGDIYFKISKFEKYGELEKLDIENLKQNADGRLNNNDEYEKEDARDFALWKAYSDGDGEVFWDTEIGKGRPGWHIECSAMSKKTLGQPFDIHTGGVDLIFPHHTNEIAQSECAYDSKYCTRWMHNDHLIVNGEKMSKSAGNFYTLRDLIAKGYSAISIRLEMLSTHYRQKLDFREDNLKNMDNTLRKIHDFIDRIESIDSDVEDSDYVNEIIKTFKKKFDESLDNDLNISGALAALFEFMTEINKLEIGYGNAQDVLKFMKDMDSVLGIMEHEKVEIPEEIFQLAEERTKARSEKNWAEADRIRDELTEKGYVIEDTPEGPRVKKV